MRTNQAGIDLIKRFEGLRLTAYRDSGGIWTIGYGHIGGISEGDVITEDQAEQFLREDLEMAEYTIGSTVTADLNPNQFSALASLIYNIGIGKFAHSSMRQLLNAGDFEAAAGEFHKWANAGGQALPGLVRRRQAEEELFRRPVKPLAQSKTIKAGAIAVPSAAIGLLDQFDSVRDSLYVLVPYWKWAAFGIAMISVLSAAYMVWRRIHENAQGVH